MGLILSMTLSSIFFFLLLSFFSLQHRRDLSSSEGEYPHVPHHPKAWPRCPMGFTNAVRGILLPPPLHFSHRNVLLPVVPLGKKKRRRNLRGVHPEGETSGGTQDVFLDETNQTPERLESERERFPFCACTVLIQHSRLSAENKHFRPQLPLCSSPCLTGDVTDAFGQQCCSAGWGRGKAGSPGFAAQLPEMNDFLFSLLSPEVFWGDKRGLEMWKWK